jgi:hypothetical protein
MFYIVKDVSIIFVFCRYCLAAALVAASAAPGARLARRPGLALAVQGLALASLKPDPGWSDLALWMVRWDIFLFMPASKGSMHYRERK